MASVFCGCDAREPLPQLLLVMDFRMFFGFQKNFNLSQLD